MRQHQRAIQRLIASTSLASILTLALNTSAFALVIGATFDSTITSDPNAAAIEGVINTAIGTYESTFSDPITVSIDFKEMLSGLGESITGFYKESYTSFITALHNDATSSADATALAHLPIQVTNPVTGSTSINGSSANLRALGFNTPGFVNGTFDGQILLNKSADRWRGMTLRRLRLPDLRVGPSWGSVPAAFHRLCSQGL